MRARRMLRVSDQALVSDQAFRCRPRVVDTELTDHLAAAGAVVIEGPRGCGKTETACQAAATRFASMSTNRPVSCFSRLRMRPMSLFESGHSSAEVSLGALLDGAEPRAADPA